jgi:hypothetical protein
MSINSAGGDGRAALWSGTAVSFVDLHPAGALSSWARATDGSRQVGGVQFPGLTGHAALWSGTAESFVDLNAFLGTNYGGSGAMAIWSDGGTTYVVGSGGDNHAILWTIREAPDMPPLNLASWQWSGGANVVTLTWTNNGSSCVLESTGSLTGGWNTVSTPLTTNASWISAMVTNAASAQFFRLRGN